MDLSTTYLGLNLRSPLVVSASPLSQELPNIRKMEDAGAAAVVLYSLFEEQLVLEQHELHYHTVYHNESFPEALTYFPEPEEYHTGPEQYLKHIQEAKAAVDIPIIASLNGSTIGGWIDFAKKIQDAGADALELNIYSIPTDMELSSAEVEERLLEVIRAVKGAVTIPVAVKLSPFFSNMAYMAKRMDAAGADGLVMFNRFYQPDIDLETLEVRPNVLLSTPQALRLPLRWIAILYGNVDADLAATSGIHQAEDVIKMLMVGANVTMLASALFRKGIAHLNVVETNLRNWLIENEYESVKQMRGSMSYKNSGQSGRFERAQYIRGVSSLPEGIYPDLK
jgi:dihydroorotate dehydrogenase (fumarate)